jgi:hypothetical protein
MRVTFFFVSCELDNPCAKVRTHITRKKNYNIDQTTFNNLLANLCNMSKDLFKSHDPFIGLVV